MKPLKLILLFFALVAIQIATAEWLNVPPPVEARGLMMVGGGVPVVAAECTTSSDTELVTQSTQTTTSSLDTTGWRSQQFTLSANSTITEYSVNIRDINNSGNIFCAVYTNSGDDKPSSIVADSTVTLAASTVDDTQTNKSFTLAATISLTGSTKYHLVCGGSGTTPSFFWGRSGTDVYASHGYAYSSDGGSTWGTGTDIDFTFTIMGCQP